jgi:hypothetical protein
MFSDVIPSNILTGKGQVRQHFEPEAAGLKSYGKPGKRSAAR